MAIISKPQVIYKGIPASFTLFKVVGTSYGAGNGSTTFNLPNPDSNSNNKLIIKF